MTIVDRRSFLAHAAALPAAGALGRSEAARAAVDGEFAALIDAERRAIGAAMATDGIGAAAICLVHRERPVWVEGFGHAGASGDRPVGPDTLFSIQSTSKSFAAVAALLAVQDGLLDLDAPITRYLPEFKVNSRFEPAPHERITVRLLLANRAGFTHEAPIGNNYHSAAPSFAAHIRSISDTWLRFPVGDRYRYSNLGYDLAGHIVERVAGIPYAEWLRRRIFEPLGMSSSTADPAVYTANANRAAGTHKGYDAVPLVTPLVVSGGVWTNAHDMAAYATFLTARGRWRDRHLLAPELWTEMHGFSLGGDYGLGVMRSERRYGSTPVRLLHHRGGGFGFGCNFVYCPEAELGWAALFNRPALAGYRFGMDLLDKALAQRFGPRAPRLPVAALAPIRLSPERARALAGHYIGRNVSGTIEESGGKLRFRKDEAKTGETLELTSPDELFAINAEGETITYRYYPAAGALPAHLECSKGEASLDYNGGPHDAPGPDSPGWQRYVGRYRIQQWGKPAIDVVIARRHGFLEINGTRLVVEFEPGLFFTSDGEAVDFRGEVPTWRNLILEPA
ncbi:class A beta-lactamase-related serine hydrolase [Sphingopyxis sp. PAMC25046]|uniref:serine hydrolase domain-containing protein n=1 Tax=Sphingopyxis sp. PAMC25046 TaxID=2565556 RepID=UPI00109DF850|nr:serine hydrolase domain-containing protein [Sphingopyxis sp. PAMC25046]QCB55786.1 class A beta-lactamase-related serine hydrolase [Sphingopyxis sp. PAMC25046]